MRFAWLREATPEARRALLAATSGWMLDAMDVMLYAFALTAIRAEFGLDGAQAGLLASVTLIASAVGGIGAGILADRFGRARILVLSSFSEDSQIVESMRAGALGYLLKTAKLDDLVTAIRQINNGETPLNPLVARRLVVTMSSQRAEPNLLEVLTDRELMILPLVVRGMTNKEIGDRLGITLRTAGTHIGNMIRKAGVENRVQLSMLAVRQGLTSLYAGEN